MKKKILTIFTILLIATSGLNFVSAQNETDDILIFENTEEELNENRINRRDDDINENAINTNDTSIQADASENRIGEEVKSLENGYADILFDDGYRGYCVNHDLLSTSQGEKFIVESTDNIISSKYGESVGNYLKILFVDHYTYTMNPTTDLSQAIWTFTDNYYKNSDNELIKSILESAANGRVIPDHGAVAKVNSTTEAMFDFECLDSIYHRTQNFFGYKINYRTLEQNNTQIEDEILGTAPENNTDTNTNNNTPPENNTDTNTNNNTNPENNNTDENTTVNNKTTENSTVNDANQTPANQTVINNNQNNNTHPENNTIPNEHINEDKNNATYSISKINDDPTSLNQNENVNLEKYKTGIEIPILIVLLLLLAFVLIIRYRD